MHSRAHGATAAVAALIVCSGCNGRAASDSVYTSLRESDCHAPPQEIAAPYQRRDLGVQECPAFPEWRLLLVSSDANSWVDVSSPGVAWSGERAIVYEQPIGLFSGVDAGTDVEWRRTSRGELTAIIVRLLAQDREALTAQQSRRLVVRVTRTAACVIGRVATAADARALADSTRAC
jgi:hypothetical protein